MEWKIEPWAAVGPIRFGMRIDEVRSALGEPFVSFHKSKDSQVPADAFDSLGIHVHYRAPDRCAAVEFWGTVVDPTLYGEHLLRRPYAQVQALIAELDPGLIKDRSDTLSPKLGVALYASQAVEDEQAPVEGVLVSERGYLEPPRSDPE